jgi:hypothetical protein
VAVAAADATVGADGALDLAVGVAVAHAAHATQNTIIDDPCAPTRLVASSVANHRRKFQY